MSKVEHRVSDQLCDCLKEYISETSTPQYYDIIYNTQRDVQRLVSSCENNSSVLSLEFPLPLPLPPKKKIHNLPKNIFPSRPLHHQCVDPGADSMDFPHLRVNCVVLTEDSYPGRTSNHVFVSSRTHISSPLTIVWGLHTLTLPSPGVNPTIYPSFPTLT